MNVRTRLLGILVLVSSALWSCAQSDDVSLRSLEQQLYSEDHARVFGFEDPVSDWTGPLGRSSSASQGAYSARVISAGQEFSLTSRPLESLGEIGDELLIDMKPPAVEEGWSYLRVVVRSAEQQIWYGELDRVNLAQSAMGGATPGAFNTLRFPLQGYKQQLSGQYSDLTVELIANGPAGAYEFDNLSFGGEAIFDESDGAGGATGGQGSSVGGTPNSGDTGGSGNAPSDGEQWSYLQIRTPAGFRMGDVLLGAQDGDLRVSDNVVLLGSAHSYASVSRLGPGGSGYETEIGVAANVGRIAAEGDLFLRSNAIVHDGVRLSGELDSQGTVPMNVVTGASLLPYNEESIPYEFPENMAPSGYYDDGTTRRLVPGGYEGTFVQNSSSLQLEAGVYYFDALRVEPGSRLDIDNESGTVFVFVRGEFSKRGTLVYTAPEKANVLFAVTGAGPVAIAGGFRGTIVAPGAELELPTNGSPEQTVVEGAFFGRSVTVHPATTYRHVPFARADCETACGLMFGCSEEETLKACPGAAGEDCSGGCLAGLECGADNGMYFGLSRAADVCWNPDLCETDRRREHCGARGDACGEVCQPEPTPCVSAEDCAVGDVCGTDNGSRYGVLDINVCEPSACVGSPSAAECGHFGSPCGLCECQPNCEEKICGDDLSDGCGGHCLGLCAETEGCSSNLDCGRGELCVTGSDAIARCRLAECADADAALSECRGGMNSCGEPCQCDGPCLLALEASYVESETPPPSTVGSVEGALSVSPSGSLSYSIPLKLPPGRHGLEPSLSLTYSSDAGDGIMGPGWAVTGFSEIAECPHSVAVDGHAGGVDGEATDPFCIDGERLIPVGQVGYAFLYRTEADSFRQIAGVRHGSGLREFIVRDKAGLTYTYEGAVSSRFGARLTKVWPLARVEDRYGNKIEFSYLRSRDTSVPDFTPEFEVVPDRITYSPGDREIRFKYDERGVGDARDLPKTEGYVFGRRYKRLRRLREIEISASGEEKRYYRLGYPEFVSVKPGDFRRAQLESVSECAVSGGVERCLKPTTFDYSVYSETLTLNADLLPDKVRRSPVNNPPVVFDANGDGRDDLWFNEYVLLAGAEDEVLPGEKRERPFGYGDFLEVGPRAISYTTNWGRHRRLPCFGTHGVIDFDEDGRDELVDTCGRADAGGWYGDVWSVDDAGGSSIIGQIVLPTVEFDGTTDSGAGAIYLVDVNGDSVPDVIPLRRGITPGVYFGSRHALDFDGPYFSAALGETGENVNEDQLEFFDVDGDAVADVIRPPAAHLTRAGGENRDEDWLVLRDGEWRTLGVSGRFAEDFVSLRRVKLADWNGDGLIDILMVNSTEEFVFWYNTGDDRFVAVRSPFGFDQHGGVHPVPGLLRFSLEVGSAAIRHGVLGGSLMMSHHWDPLKLFHRGHTFIAGESLDRPVARHLDSIYQGDFDGNGSLDQLIVDDQGSSRIRYTNEATQGRLREVMTGSGLKHLIGWGGTTQYIGKCSAADEESACQSRHTPMVRSVENVEVLRHRFDIPKGETRFEYGEVRHGFGGRGSFGPAERIVRSYDPDNQLVKTVKETYNNRRWILAGALLSQVTELPPLENADGSLASEGMRFGLHNQWEEKVSDAGRPFPVLTRAAKSVNYLREGWAPPTIVSEATRYVYDEYGNEKESTTSYSDQIMNPTFDVRTVETKYAHEDDAAFVENWLMSLPSKTTETHSTNRHTSLAEEVTRTVGRTFDSETGALRGVQWEASDADARLEAILTPDQFGNLVHVVEESFGSAASTREYRTFYDNDGLYPDVLQDPLGYEFDVEFDRFTGAPVYERDPNGLVTRWSYDEFGRVAEESGWQGRTRWTYSDPLSDPWSGNGLFYVSSRARLRVTESVDGGGETETDYDAFSRSIMTRWRGYQGKWVTQAQLYDWRGNLKSESQPHAGTDESPGMISYVYDLWGRLRETQFPDGTRTEVGYAFRHDGGGDWMDSATHAIMSVWTSDRLSSVEPTVPESISVLDHRGQTVRMINAEGTRTDYVYRPFGDLSRVDHDIDRTPKLITELLYDEWGRLREQHDPDLGSVSYRYDGFGAIRELSDPRGLVTTFRTDAKGRQVERLDEWPSGDTEVSTWTYDTAPGGIGRLHHMVSPDNVATNYEYYRSGEDTPGYLKKVQLTVDGESFMTRLGYDEHRRVKVVRYPQLDPNVFGTDGSRFEVVYNYNDVGLPLRVDGAPNGAVDPTAEPLWEFGDSYQGYLVSQDRLGGVVDRTTLRNPENARVVAIQSSKTRAGDRQYETYSYYPNGDLLERSTVRATPDESRHAGFIYDSLHRVVSASSRTGDAETTNVFEYDRLGNIMRKGWAQYEYEPLEQPHAVTRVGENRFSYDAAGNQVARSGPWVEGGEQTLEYNAFNLPRWVSLGPAEAALKTEFQYSATGSRVLKRSDLGESVLVGDFYERVKEFGDDFAETHKFYVHLGGEVVTQVSRRRVGGERTEKVNYFLRDRLGSVIAVLDDQGDIESNQEFGPFGNSMNGAFSDSGVRLGFTGHPHDALSGLIDMGGRMYDPQLARFLSADPLVQDPFSVQSLNRYSYAWNNPLGLVDPSGFQAQGPTGGGGGMSSYTVYAGEGGQATFDIGGRSQGLARGTVTSMQALRSDVEGRVFGAPGDGKLPYGSGNGGYFDFDGNGNIVLYINNVPKGSANGSAGEQEAATTAASSPSGEKGGGGIGRTSDRGVDGSTSGSWDSAVQTGLVMAAVMNMESGSIRTDGSGSTLGTPNGGCPGCSGSRAAQAVYLSGGVVRAAIGVIVSHAVKGAKIAFKALERARSSSFAGSATVGVSATKGAAAMTTKQAAQVLKQAPGSFPNMPAFGRAVGWGRNGGEAAFARAGSITKAEAQSLGITSSEAFAIRDAYRAVLNSSKGAANPTALGREALMNRVGQLLQ